MQSRLALTSAAKLNRLLISGSRKQFLAQRLGYANTTGRTADPAEHAVDPEEVQPTEAIEDEKRRHSSPKHKPTTKDDNPFIPPKSPIQSEIKIGSDGVGPRTNPFTQQKRSISARIEGGADDACAAVIDPWPEEDNDIDMKRQREEQHKDNVEYFKENKASPISEIEIADTRKPIDQATDGIEPP